MLAERGVEPCQIISFSRICSSVPTPLNDDACGTGFQVIDTRQRHARAHGQPEEPAEAFPEQQPSQEMDALTEPHSSAEEDAHMPEAGSPQQPRPHAAAAQHSRQQSSASAGFAADFGDTATSFDGERIIQRILCLSSKPVICSFSMNMGICMSSMPAGYCRLVQQP